MYRKMRRVPEYEPRPRWVKIFAVVAAVVVVLLAVVLIARGGDHGPSRHGAPALTP